MVDEKNNILFTLVYQGCEYRVQTFKNQYHTLMTLISDQLAIPGFGLCSGMGSCGTCMVDIYESGLPHKKNTLSCGVQVDEELANSMIIIPDEIY